MLKHFFCLNLANQTLKIGKKEINFEINCSGNWVFLFVFFRKKKKTIQIVFLSWLKLLYDVFVFK